MPKPPSIADILAGAENIRRYEIEERPDGTRRISTNGTVDDNAAAAAALKILSLTRAPIREEMAPGITSPLTVLIGAFRLWKIHLTHTTRMPKTLAAKLAAVQAFVEWKGENVRVHTVTHGDVSEWLQALFNSGLLKNTASNKLTWLAGFFRWAQNAGYYATGRNPAEGHLTITKRDKSDSAHKRGWQPFSPEQVQAIFAPGQFSAIRGGHTRWCAVLGLYTGARVNELAQLAVSDFGEQDGQPFLRIGESGLGQSVKTDASRRVVPLHPDLLSLGLLGMVERVRATGAIRLFPDLSTDGKNGPGNAVSKAFSYHLKRVGVVAVGEGRVGFHSFRKTLIQTLKAAKVPRECREEFTGHEKAQRNISDVVYSADHGPAALGGLVFPGIQWGAGGVVDLEALRGELAD